MNVVIQGDKHCWICGTYGKEHTLHHCLPKHLQPKRNVIIPVCQKCHDLLNVNDIKGLIAFAYKINRIMKVVRNMTASLCEGISHHNKKEKKK